MIHPAREDLPPDVQTAQDLRPSPVWGPVRKLFFRFLFAYLLLFNFPFPLYYIPYVNIGYLKIWQPIVTWAGKHVFNMAFTARGGSDSTYNYVQIFCFLVISIAAALIWTFLDRKRRSYARLYEWLRVYVRFVLAVTMIEYGASKVFPSQFPAPTIDRLMQPLGDASPMGLLWTFMGASVAYTVFSGLSEMIGGLLLTLRRTTLFGALICIGVMGNVVMLNFSYDVSVKVYSVHLLLMAVFLAAHDLRRLANVLVLNRAAEPEEIRPLFRRKRVAHAATAFAALFILYETGTTLYGSYGDTKDYDREAASRLPLYGMWNVEEILVDGKVRPPLVTDGKRWRRLFFTTPGRIAIQLMSDSRERYDLELDEKKRTLLLGKRDDPDWKTTLVYRRPRPDLLFVEGPFDGHEVRARLRLTQPPEFLLETRGFHWINERPLNR
ncbi:MAG TPA: hypothetical protein VH394_14995 [Thermoanaerobaculia bacterium]|nr:hypothetical protein [Thermoanaerobaculia bacterium]